MTTVNLQTALSHQQAGRLEQAEAAYQELLKKRPSDAQILQLYGTLLAQRGQFDAAIVNIRRAIQIDANQPDARMNLGVVLGMAGRHAEAIGAYEAALALRPQSPETWFNLGCAAHAMKDWTRAVAAFEKAVGLRPDYPEAHNNLGESYRELGNIDKATVASLEAIRLRPDFALAHFNLAKSFQIRGNIVMAMTEYHRATSLDANLAEAWSNLSHLLSFADRNEDAARAARRAIELSPDLTEPKVNLGNALQYSGRVPEAIDLFQQAKQSPIGHSNLLYAMHLDEGYDADAIFREHRNWNEMHAAGVARMSPTPKDRHPDRRLRIGYVSADFRGHSVAAFVERILQNHDPRNVEVICYSDVPCEDDVTWRLMKFCRQWRKIAGLSDQKVAESIREDGVDILVDLAGHTAGNRLAVFAKKPAPIQITYLGYPDTTGLTAMDYRITDAIADVPGRTESLHTERLLRMPECFLCYAPPGNAPEVNDLPASTANGITFGSFNNLAKISDRTVQMWSRVLQQVSGSRLIVKGRGLAEASAKKYLRERFAGQSIDANRVELLGQAPDLPSHLAQYHHIDIALDTFPYNGTTTTCEAIWMGVPVITLAGQTHASRVAASILTALRMPQLITAAQDEFVNRAVELAGDVGQLAAHRASMRERMTESLLTDGKRFVQNLESLYRQAWSGGAG